MVPTRALTVDLEAILTQNDVRDSKDRQAFRLYALSYIAHLTELMAIKTDPDTSSLPAEPEICTEIRKQHVAGERFCKAVVDFHIGLITQLEAQ